MARRITNGIQGRNVLGNIVAVQNSLRSVLDNEDVVLQASGTGITRSTTDLQVDDAGSLRLADADSSAYVALRAPSTVASDVTLTLPGNEGSNGQVLTTDGSGGLSWSTTSLSVQNRTAADNNTYYIAMVDEASRTGGSEDTLSIADSSRLQFVPNPGLLTVNQINVESAEATSSTTTGALVVSGGVGIGGSLYAGNTVRFTNTTASSSTTTGALVVSGGVGIAGTMTATSIVETSSIALKENIEPISNALDSVLALKGVTYDRLDNNEHESGLIAEWVEEVLPDLVTRDQQGKVVGIKYTKLTAYLIESIKKLKSEIDEIRSLK